MNKIILIFLIIYNKTNTFIENIIQQEYSVICEEKNSQCSSLHFLYNQCGTSLFDIWLSLDLLLSVRIEFNDYNKFYDYLNDKIKIIDNEILKIQKENNKKHRKDNEKLLFYIQKIMDHQIIKYNERIFFIMQECKEKIIEILIDNTL